MLTLSLLLLADAMPSDLLAFNFRKGQKKALSNKRQGFNKYGSYLQKAQGVRRKA
jgi:hypothetical protein